MMSTEQRGGVVEIHQKGAGCVIRWSIGAGVLEAREIESEGRYMGRMKCPDPLCPGFAKVFATDSQAQLICQEEHAPGACQVAGPYRAWTMTKEGREMLLREVCIGAQDER